MERKYLFSIDIYVDLCVQIGSITEAAYLEWMQERNLPRIRWRVRSRHPIRIARDEEIYRGDNIKDWAHAHYNTTWNYCMYHVFLRNWYDNVKKTSLIYTYTTSPSVFMVWWADRRRPSGLWWHLYLPPVERGSMTASPAPSTRPIATMR